MMPQSAPIKHQKQYPSSSRSFEEIRYDLIERHFFVQTDQYLELEQWLDDLRKYKSCGRLSGSRDVGKSKALQEYVATVNGHRGSLRRIKPLRSFYLKSFTSWGITDICNRTLELLNHGARKGSPKDRRLRTWEMFEDFGLELLILDNAHLVTDKVFFDLIECYRDFRIATVLVGSDDELDKRLRALGLIDNFRRRYEFHPLSPRQAVEVLKKFQKDFLELPESPLKFFNGTIVDAICEASGGDPSKLDKPGCNFTAISNILAEAIAKSSENGIFCLDKLVLQEVLYDYGVVMTVKETNGIKSEIT